MGNDGGAFWTFCPYCFYMYSYDKVYEGCCLRCQNVGCRRAFHGVCVGSSLPTKLGLDKGQSFGCFGYFPLGFSPSGGDSKAMFENWSPLVGFFPVERMENACDDNDNYDDDDVGVMDDSDELEQDVFGNQSGEKRNTMSRRKMVARTAKKLRTRRRSNKDDGENDDDGGGFSGFKTGSNVASGSGYVHDNENMNFFEQDGDVFVRFGSDDSAF